MVDAVWTDYGCRPGLEYTQRSRNELAALYRRIRATDPAAARALYRRTEETNRALFGVLCDGAAYGIGIAKFAADGSVERIAPEDFYDTRPNAAGTDSGSQGGR